MENGARSKDLRLSQLRFFFNYFRTESRARLRDDMDVGSGTLDPVHNSGPSLVESTSSWLWLSTIFADHHSDSDVASM